MQNYICIAFPLILSDFLKANHMVHHLKQLERSGQEQRLKLKFHQRLMNDELPLSIGGGIGQSRLCMLYLRKAHIGEIQASIWPEEMIGEFKRNNIVLL
jgi:aspartate--ammonia ligase